jgi:pimeloyl-ACP methyl ester carboxylesterase
VAGHGKGVPKNVTHAEETRSIVDFIVGRDLTDFILVGHGYAGTIISKAAEAIPERVRRLVFWSAYVLNDGQSALEMLPDTIELLTPAFLRAVWAVGRAVENGEVPFAADSTQLPRRD